MIVICGSFTLGRLFEFTFAHSWFIEALTFLEKLAL